MLKSLLNKNWIAKNNAIRQHTFAAMAWAWFFLRKNAVHSNLISIFVMFCVESQATAASVGTLAESVFRNYADIDFVEEFLNFCPLLLYFFKVFFWILRFGFYLKWKLQSGQKFSNFWKAKAKNSRILKEDFWNISENIAQNSEAWKVLRRKLKSGKSSELWT